MSSKINSLSLLGGFEGGSPTSLFLPLDEIFVFLLGVSFFGNLSRVGKSF
jgi:hypothetical protein